MSTLGAKIRAQLIESFRTELAEHIETLTNGLLAIEQSRVTGDERDTTLGDIFRAAHSLKGAARAVGVTSIEQIAHGMESILYALQQEQIVVTPELFSTCYRAMDAIQAVQTTLETGETTPPAQALLAVAELEAIKPAGARQPERRRRRSRSKPAEFEERTQPPPEAQPARAPAIARRSAITREPEPEPRQPRAAGGDETIRASVRKLDLLMAQLSELLVAKINLEQRLTQMRQLQDLAGTWQREWLAVRGTYNRLMRQERDGILGLHRLRPVEMMQDDMVSHTMALSHLRPPSGGSAVDGQSVTQNLRELSRDLASLMDFVGVTQTHLASLNTLANDLSRQYASNTTQLALVIDELEQEIKGLRMLPVSTITAPFGRMVRDLAQASNKEAVLNLVGGETELDKRVLEQIKDPLIHLLRNAVDHGVETPQEREAAGKPHAGRIALAAEQLGKSVVISVSDDGSGLDMDDIRQVVARRRKVDASSLSNADLLEAIFAPGVSTSPIITDISGRGVGLDIVRRNVEKLRGRIDIQWEQGQGTTVTLTLPLTLTSSRGLLVRSTNQVYAIPLSAIERIMAIAPKDIAPLGGQDTIQFDGRAVTLVRLSEVLALPPTASPPEGSSILVVILSAGDRRMAFAVNELLGEQELVIKGLGKQLTRVAGIAGATVMGNGEVVLILNVADMIRLAMRGEHRSLLDTVTLDETEGAVLQRRILVVDDSITTRTLEKNILEAAGYIVLLATDGEEALATMALDGVPDLVVADVVMPRMNGFDLTQRIKQDEKTASLPVILVTSLDSPRDKAQGIEVGADAYIVKDTFDQDNLLETIEQLI